MSIWLSVIILAVLQGLTEFLPVSSSGHLAVLSRLFGVEENSSLAFGIILHTGSLAAIVIFYFKILLGFFKKDQLHLLLMVIVGTIPAGIAGVLLKKTGLADRIFNDLVSTGLAFLVTAALLRLTSKQKLIPQTQTELKDITLKQALITGVVQMFAILPGISRSGSTISAAILAGVKYEAAAAFSFLLALPAIAGASLLEIIELKQDNFNLGEFTPLHLGIGFLVSALTSFGALTLLLYIIKKNRLSFFSWYLSALGLAVLAWQMIKLG